MIGHVEKEKGMKETVMAGADFESWAKNLIETRTGWEETGLKSEIIKPVPSRHSVYT